MKPFIKIFLVCACMLYSVLASAQKDTVARHQVAFFLPLYLDSAFDASDNYKFDKNFPKFLSQGLEFYEGVQLALDSLQIDGLKIDVRIYDTRSRRKNIAQILHEPDFEKTELMIGLITGSDLGLLAQAARRKNIPFINTNFPNDAGIRNNPDLVLLNPTLQTHCEGIYKYLQSTYSTSPVIMFTKKGALEERLKNYFSGVEKQTASVPLKMRTVTLAENFTTKDLLPFLDSTRQNVLVAASMDGSFAGNLCRQLAELQPHYACTILGMPNWDNILDLTEPEYTGLEVIYSTPFYNNNSLALVKNIQQVYKAKFYSRPSDLVFRGYEAAWDFLKLLQLYGSGVSGSIGEKKFNIINEFNIQPVFTNRQSMTLDYFENKKLYFLKKVSGVITTVN